jgi:adenylate kinase
VAKRVILITGTPCVGKTSTSRLLTDRLDALYINLTDLALRDHLTSGKDKKRNSVIVDEARMKERIREIIDGTDRKDVVVDGHYAVNVVPQELVTLAFVLRCDPVQLRRSMQKSGFPEPKLTENLASEILDVPLVDALNAGLEGRTCEVNVTGRTTREVVDQVLKVMADPTKCCVGIVDWLGKLESEGLLDEYLKI